MRTTRGSEVDAVENGRVHTTHAMRDPAYIRTQHNYPKSPRSFESGKVRSRHATMPLAALRSMTAEPTALSHKSAVRSFLQAARRNVRETIERSLHPRRRLAARRRLAVLQEPRSVLFLCHGNICRSSYAEFALRRLVRDRTQAPVVESAGFIGPDRPPPLFALAVALQRGIDMTNHRSRLVTDAMLAAADVVLVMSTAQARLVRDRARTGRVFILGDLDPEVIEQRTIRDPWNEPEAVFMSSYERIDRCVGELARVITAGGRPDPRTA
jgi:protein-tyrosine phosphatase